MPEPTVSVVVPTHNRPEWLAETVRSILASSFGDFEVIVSNNGDPGDTRSLASTLPDSRLRWIESDRETGMLQNLLAGLSHARGRFVAVLHDDDTWSPDFLSTMVASLESDAAVVVAFADHHVVDASGEIIVGETEANTRRWGRSDLSEGLHRPFYELAARQSIPITGCVFRRDAVATELLTPDIEAFYDIWISYLLARTGGAAHYCPRRLMYYRAHTSSHSSGGRLSSRQNAIHGREVMLSDPLMAPYRDLIVPRLAREHTWAGAEHLRRGERVAARTHLRQALRLRPSVHALAGWGASWIAPRSVLAHV